MTFTLFRCLAAMILIRYGQGIHSEYIAPVLAPGSTGGSGKKFYAFVALAKGQPTLTFTYK